MRIWDVSPSILCRKHLLGEHRELHALWTIITENKTGYRNHPETKRWIGKLKSLYLRHAHLVQEMEKRGYRHNSPLNDKLATGNHIQDIFVNTIAEQMQSLRNKDCDCPLDKKHGYPK